MKNRLLKGASVLLATAVLLTSQISTISASNSVAQTSKGESANTDNTTSTSINDGTGDKSVESTTTDNTADDSTNSTPNGATSNETSSTPSDTTDVKQKGDNVTIDKNDKPYLSLGANLTADQQRTVLQLMGISYDKLGDYDVNYVNNQEEHQYLDSYISKKEIGSRSLSSVVVTKAEKGTGLNVSTYNIGYCTVGMYKNALATAGITDANIIVAAPFKISGTAALVGAFKAYKDMTGKELDKDAVDASLDEIVTTGQLEQNVDGDKKEDLEAMIADLKQQIANGDLKTENDIKQAIDEASDKYKIKLSQEDIDKLINLLKKFKDIDIDWGAVKDQAQAWADKLGINMTNASSFFGKIVDFFKAIWEFIVGLFS